APAQVHARGWIYSAGRKTHPHLAGNNPRRIPRKRPRKTKSTIPALAERDAKLGIGPSQPHKKLRWTTRKLLFNLRNELRTRKPHGLRRETVRLWRSPRPRDLDQERWSCTP